MTEPISEPISETMTAPPTDHLGSERTRLRRRPARGAYDRASVDAILDDGFVCHVGFVHDGQPFVIPTAYARLGEALYIHGSAASRMLRSLRDGVPLCVTVTLVDGIVLARSAFHHSMNYRSVVVLGVAVAVTDEAEQLRGLRAIVERMRAGRWAEVRPPTPAELRATMVLRLPITEASAKVRSGGPLDDEADLAWPCWAGHVPLGMVAHDPVPDGVAHATPPSPGSFHLGARRP